MPHQLSKLACGFQHPSSDLGTVLEHIANMIDQVAAEIELLKEQNDDHMTMYGPFLGRTLIELVFTALIGRLDPYRLLVLRQIQKRPNYDIAVRNSCAINWQGDVIPPSATPNLFGLDLKPEKISRALLGDHFGEIFWKSSFESLLDEITNAEAIPSGLWLNELQTLLPDSFVQFCRSRATHLYSSLSKGIHHEFLIPPNSLYDRATVKLCIEDTLKLLGHCTLVSHMILHAPGRVPFLDAIALYSELEKIEV